MNDSDYSENNDDGRSSLPRKFQKKDPLVILGLVVIVAGVILIAYGFTPIPKANYVQIAQGPVPLTDASNNFITNPEGYFQSHYNGTGAINMVDCSPSTNGFYCYGFEFIGTVITYSLPAKQYGAGMVILGVLAIYAGNRFSPLKPKPRHARPITIRVDEDICISNGVCVGLAPTVFQLKKQESPTIFAPLAYVVDPYGADNDTIIQAAQMCPTGAIIIEDAETGERIHPPFPKE